MKYKVLGTFDNYIFGEYDSLWTARVAATHYTINSPYWHIVVDEQNHRVGDPYHKEKFEKIPLFEEEVDG